VVRLEFGPVPLAASAGIEGYLPPDLPLLPHAVFGNGSAWADVARHYARIVDRQIGDVAYGDVARGIVGAEQSRTAIVQKLLDAVQKRVRYVGIEFGESGIIPHPPQETLKLRYGDCKDQSTLLVALLRSLGHPAQVVLLRAGRREDLLPDVPALNAFDHAIVHVPGNPPLWIDPTAALLRVGELPQADMGRLALIASPATTELVRTPEPQSAENRAIRTRELVLASEDHGRLRESADFHGFYEHQVRSYYAEKEPEDLRRDLAAHLKESYGADRLTAFDYGDAHDLTAAFRVSYEADGIDHGVTRPVCSVALVPETILDEVPWPLRQYTPPRKPGPAAGDDPAGRWERTAPLQFLRPSVRELRYRVILPTGFAAPKLPDSFSKQFGPTTISASFQAESENLIVATFRLDSGSGRLSPDEARGLREFLGHLHSGSNGAWLVPLELEHTASQHIAQGQVREGLGEFQRLVERHSADLELRTWYVESLVTVGLGAAAREEARRATELDPQSALAWHALGYARMHDDFGRFMGPGNDPLTAEAALRKAVELDPQLHVARWNLAVTLEHGSGPRRYAPGPRLAEAAEHYRTLRAAEYPQPALPANLLLTLAYSENWPEILKVSAQLPASLVRNAVWVAAVAATANVAAAKAKAIELGESDDARRDVLLNASDLLNNTRRYAASAELTETALPLIPDSEVRKRVQAIAAGVKITRRIDEALLPADDPRRLVQQLHVAAFSGSAAESASPLFVEEAGPGDAGSALEIIRTRHAGIIRSALKTNKSSERLGDLAAVLELKSDGDAELGYRVQAETMRWYVVQRNGELKLFPPGLEFTELGREALRLLDLGNESGARRWLEWAAVEMPPPTGLFADPFSVSPFGYLWNVLKRDQLKVAAALLAAPGGKSDEAERILTEYQQTATSKVQLLQIDRALTRTFFRRDDWERVLEFAERVQATHKSAEEPRQWKVLALTRLKRVDELRELEEERLSKMNGHARTWAEGQAAARRGDFELSQKLMRQLADDASAKADPTIFNGLAWHALFTEQGPTVAALEDAVKANARTDYRNHALLHTLATVHAELDQPVEARKFLMQAIEARDGKPVNEDLYVLGRIAECYGLNQIAAAHYAQVQSAEGATSTYQLAQRRLKRLATQ
jgi:transglutaminase-like putative cysteine protease